MEWWLLFEPVTKEGLSLLGSPCQTEDGGPGFYKVFCLIPMAQLHLFPTPVFAYLK